MAAVVEKIGALEAIITSMAQRGPVAIPRRLLLKRDAGSFADGIPALVLIDHKLSELFWR